MRRRRRRKRDQGSVEMNLAAMLDMAFQLLTFFILTFRPAPIEGQLALHMPPPVPTTKVEANAVGPSDKLPEVNQDLELLHLQVTAGPLGEVKLVSIEKSTTIAGPMDSSSVQQLEKSLHGLFGLQHIPFDRIQIAVEGPVRYGELMKIVDVCSRQKRADGELIHKISFTEL